MGLGGGKCSEYEQVFIINIIMYIFKIHPLMLEMGENM